MSLSGRTLDPYHAMIVNMVDLEKRDQMVKSIRVAIVLMCFNSNLLVMCAALHPHFRRWRAIFLKIDPAPTPRQPAPPSNTVAVKQR
jgi:hypothetical protein